MPGLSALLTYGAVQVAAHFIGIVAASRGVDPYLHAWHGYEMYPSEFGVVALLAAGAVGACLSRRAGGRLGDRVIASLFPALLFGMMLTVMLVGDSHRSGVWSTVSGSIHTLLGWTVIAGIALLVAQGLTTGHGLTRLAGLVSDAGIRRCLKPATGSDGAPAMLNVRGSVVIVSRTWQNRSGLRS